MKTLFAYVTLFAIAVGAASSVLLLLAMISLAFASGAPKPPAAPSKVIGCMSLVSPTMLFCSDSSNRGLMCDTSGPAPACQTLTALYRSWRGHPERRETFMRKLYGAEAP